MINGFVKLPRNIITHPVFDVPILFHTFCYFLLSATWKDRIIIIDGTKGVYSLKLLKGQIFVTRSFLAQYLNISLPTLDRHIRILEKELSLISTQRRNSGIIITIENWSEYNNSIDDSICNSIDNSIDDSINGSICNSIDNSIRRKEKEPKRKEYIIQENKEITHTTRACAQGFDSLVEAIWGHYPKKVSPIQAKIAIINALNRDDATLIISGTIAYGKAVSFWMDKNQALNPIKFFEGAEYLSDWNAWLPRNKRGSSADNSWDNQDIQEVMTLTENILGGKYGTQ